MHLGFSVIGLSASRRAIRKILIGEADAILLPLVEITPRPRRIVLLGDVKECLGYPRAVFRDQLAYFFRKLAEHFERIIIVRGNHDGRIAELLDHFLIDAVVTDMLLIRDGNVLCLHGHMRPTKDYFDRASVILSGHIHPIDADGRKVFVLANFAVGSEERHHKKLVILPTSNPKLSGTVIGDRSHVSRVVGRLIPIEYRDSYSLLRISLLRTNSQYCLDY